MKAALSIIFAVAFFAALTPVVAQSEKMTESEYNVVLMKALQASSARDRRILTEEKFYDGSQQTGTRRIVSDFVGSGAKKIEVREDFNGKKSKSDSITIGGQFFCRDGEKAWKRADKECSKAGKAMVIPDGNYEYSVETDAKDPSRKTYIRRATFTDAGSPERSAVRLKFIEIKFTADDNGIIEYTETRRGGLEQNGWSSTQVTRYEYEPSGMKIEAPTNGNQL